MLIPCKANKCILFPVCISRRDIVCDDLRSFYHHVVIHTAEFNCPDKNKERITVWETIKQTLPNLSTLKGKTNGTMYCQ